MKTNLKRQIKSAEDAISYLDDLHSNGELDAFITDLDLRGDKYDMTDEDYILFGVRLDQMEKLKPHFDWNDYAIELLEPIIDPPEVHYVPCESCGENAHHETACDVCEHCGHVVDRTEILDTTIEVDPWSEQQEDKTSARTYYKVKTPGTFADITASKGGGYLLTLEDAQEALHDWSHKKKAESDEWLEYWLEQGDLCSIVRVTEIEEVIQEPKKAVTS